MQTLKDPGLYFKTSPAQESIYLFSYHGSVSLYRIDTKSFIYETDVGKLLTSEWQRQAPPNRLVGAGE